MYVPNQDRIRLADPNNPSAIFFRDLGDGRGVWVYPMIYTFKLVIGRIGWGAYDNGWCYADLDTAATAFLLWDPLDGSEPAGWVRHPPTGRRRFPDGDPATERVES